MGGEADLRLRSRTLLAPASGIALLTAMSTIGATVAPFLMGSHPLLLVALSPRLPFLVLAAPSVDAAPFVVVAAVRLGLADPLYFALGRRGAGAVAPRSVRVMETLSRIQGWVGSWGPLAVAARPSGLVLATAGALGLRSMTVAGAAITGTMVQVLVVYLGGRALVETSENLAGLRWTSPLVALLLVVIASLGRYKRGLVGRRLSRNSPRVHPTFSENDWDGSAL